MGSQEEVLMRPTPNVLTVAPELGVLAALDATLATAVCQLIAENPELCSLEPAARSEPPAAIVRKADLLIFRIEGVRTTIREYHALACNYDQPF